MEERVYRCYQCIIENNDVCNHLDTLQTAYYDAEIVSDEQYTPPKIIQAAKYTFGGKISLDVASCEYAQRTVGADAYYTKRQNGLLMPWYGDIWCNPPFSRGHQQLFINKGLDCYKKGTITSALYLLPHTTFFSSFGENFIQYPMCILKHVTFDRKYDSPIKMGQGFVILYLGKDVCRFYESFKALGRFVTEWRPRC